MRPLKIFGLGIVGLAAAFLIPLILDYLVLAFAACPLALLVLGQIYLPRSKRSIQVWFNPILIESQGELFYLEEPGDPVGRLNGRELKYSFFKQWHEFEIVTHRFFLLGGIGLSALAALWLTSRVLNDVLFHGMSLIFASTSLWIIIISAAMQWVWERRMLRLEGLSIGSFFVSANARRPYKQVHYFFVDHEDNHQGGCFDSMACDQSDDMTIVFYDQADPKRSIPASALLFHKLVWKEREPANGGSASSANA